MIRLNRALAIAGVSTGIWLVSPVGAQAQEAVITGKVTTEVGQPVDQAQVYITEMTISVPTNAQGVYTIRIPAARVTGQSVNLRVRAIGHQPGIRPIQVTAGTQTQDFTLRQDVNRLGEVVVTGVVGEGVERSKVPFAVGRVTAEDMPVPALDPVAALAGKVSGVRIAQTGGKPGSQPEIMLRGPISISGSRSPLFVVDGAVLNVGSYDELGALDIESVEVVKGAAGASLYGATAAAGVIVIKTKRGAAQDGVRVTGRTEYGISDLNSFDYGMPLYHGIQLDETGTRFCVNGSGPVTSCSRSVNWMSEVMRINSVAADTVRAGFGLQYGQPGLGAGDLLNVFQASPWPGQRYNTMAQMSSSGAVALHSVEASGRVAGVRFLGSGSYTDDQGAVRGLDGNQQRRARVNLDYDLRNNATLQISTVYNRQTNDNHNISFGGLLRGATPGTDYLARDTLGRPILIGFGPTSRPTGNGQGGFFYGNENSRNYSLSDRFVGTVSSSYFPTDWLTFDGIAAYDIRNGNSYNYAAKGYRTTSVSTSANFGNASMGNDRDEGINTAIGALIRGDLLSDLNGRLSVRSTYEQEVFSSQNGSGQQFIVKDIFTLSNTSQNKTATSSAQLIKRAGFYAGTTLEYKNRYILDGTFRYDGSSLFGAGNRWAPFGRISGVWRVSEEPFFQSVPYISDFRIRASDGTAGSSPGFTQQYETYSCSQSGCSLGQAGNPALKPQTTREVEVGTEFTLLNRLGVNLTHVNTTTKNQILSVPTPATLGFTSQVQNAGTMAGNTWEAELTLPVVQRRNLSWTMRGTWDRTRTYITELFRPDYFAGGGTDQGTGSFFYNSDSREKVDGVPLNQFGNIWGRVFYKGCGSLPKSVQVDCGTGKKFQVNDGGWVVWVGEGNSWKDGITKNLWQTKLPSAQSPWNVPLYFGMPIVDRPLAGTSCSDISPTACPGETFGANHIIGNTLPSFRLTWTNNIQYKRLTLYALLDGTYGHWINNQGEQWGLLDFSSSTFDMGGVSVENAKPVGYGWRVGAPEGVGSGGFYDLLGPNNYSTEKGSFTKVREASITYRLGNLRSVPGDWTVGLIGRNLFTFTGYSGYDPETGVSLIQQTDAFDFPTLRRYTLFISSRF